MLTPIVSKKVAVYAVKALSQVDYTVATRVSEDVSNIVNWAYDNNQWWIADTSIKLLQSFDDFGSLLISFVVWLVLNSK